MRIHLKHFISIANPVWIALIVLILVGTARPVFACRYTVREVAFVELSPQVFSVEFDSDWVETPEAREQFIAQSRRFVRDSNVDFSLPSDSDDSNRTRLVKVGDESFDPLGLEHLREDFNRGAQAFWSVVLDSPLRRTILDSAIDRLGVTLVVEGAIDSENSRAFAVAQAAARKVEPLLGKMAKPIDNGPQVLRVPRDVVRQERILLWSLGFDLSENASTQVATIIGRGRRLGPVLDSVTLNETALLESFVIAGQDCECDLDRVWMQGPAFPMVWGEEFRVATLDTLGFDTEDPAVRSEMSRIMARGGSRVTMEPLGQQYESLSLGYTESALHSGDEEFRELDDEALLAALEATLGTEEIGSESAPGEDPTPIETPEANVPSVQTGIWLAVGGLGFVAILGGVFVAMFRRH